MNRSKLAVSTLALAMLTAIATFIIASAPMPADASAVPSDDDRFDKGAFCRFVGCPDVGSLHCGSATVSVNTPVGGVELSVTCYQDEEGTGGPGGPGGPN